MRLFSTFGQLPGTWINLAIIVLSGMAEGAGLILFVPLLEVMTSGNAENLQWPFTLIVWAFQALGLPLTLLSLLASITVLIIGSLGIAYCQRHMIIRAKNAYTLNVRDALIRRLFRATWNHISRQSHGEFFNKLVTETQRASNALQYELLAIATMVQIFVFISFSSLLSWKLMAMTLVFGGLVAVVVRPWQRRAKILGGTTSQANRNLSFHGLDFLRAAKLIKATANEEIVIDALSGHTRALFKAIFRSDLNLVQVYFIVQALPVLLLAGVIAVSHQVLGLNTASTLVFLLFLSRIAPRIAQLQQYTQGYAIASPAIAIVDGMIAESAAASEEVNSSGIGFESLEERIALEQVSYIYPESGNTVLDGISLTIERNEFVALVGRSGGGKSTLIDILAGLRKLDGGAILIDGKNLDEFNMASWRRRIGYVTQDIIVFDDTILGNLLFAHPHATEEELAECLRLAHFDEVLAELPNGLETVLGEGGVRLSGGQKQRLALARALIGNPQLLLLDEATSALDNESERLIQDAIYSIAHKMTIVVIAHRLSTIRKADVVYVMESGRIVETGTYDELAASGGRFKEFNKMQFA